jgi:ribonuclease HI
MPWIKMRFKDQQVWVKADASGRPVLDGTGRAEMKYRETDEKSYRPAPGNLLPDTEAGADLPRDLETPKRRRVKAPPGSTTKAASLLQGGGAIEVWTDGACSGNPGPMGIGVVVLAGPQRKELGEYLGIGTNNIAELVAIERGLDLATEIAQESKDVDPRMRRIRVYSDSGYAIGLLSQGWKAKANQDLVARIRKRVTAVPNLEFVKVRGHAGVPENERCDRLAREAIDRVILRR